jgi:hypothetical protein
MGREGNKRRQRVGGVTVCTYDPTGADSKVCWVPTGIIFNPNVDFSGGVECLLTANDVWVGNQITEGFLIVLSNPWMIQSMITGALELQDN